MENFNKNWLAILLIVVVFFLLGFLTGRVTGHNHPKGKVARLEKKIMKNITDDDSEEITVKIDTLKKNSKEIQVTVEKK